MKRLLTFLICLSLFSCKDDINFNPMSNFPDEKTVALDMDLRNVVNEGIVIPSDNQCDESGFAFTFNAKKGQYYKIYYQNESYKFGDNDSLSNENFYGSWEDVSVGFKKVEESGAVTDYFRIVGNPRDEKKYYGADLTKNNFNKEAVDNVINNIKSTPEWFASVKEKAILAFG